MATGLKKPATLNFELPTFGEKGKTREWKPEIAFSTRLQAASFSTLIVYFKTKWEPCEYIVHNVMLSVKWKAQHVKCLKNIFVFYPLWYNNFLSLFVYYLDMSTVLKWYIMLLQTPARTLLGNLVSFKRSNKKLLIWMERNVKPMF